MREQKQQQSKIATHLEGQLEIFESRQRNGRLSEAEYAQLLAMQNLLVQLQIERYKADSQLRVNEQLVRELQDLQQKVTEIKQLLTKSETKNQTNNNNNAPSLFSCSAL